MDVFGRGDLGQVVVGGLVTDGEGRGGWPFVDCSRGGLVRREVRGWGK